VSFGLDLRERFESLNDVYFGVRGSPSELSTGSGVHSRDIRPNQNWQISYNSRTTTAPGKSIITRADRDPLDLAQGFVALRGTWRTAK